MSERTTKKTVKKTGTKSISLKAASASVRSRKRTSRQQIDEALEEDFIEVSKEKKENEEKGKLASPASGSDEQTIAGDQFFDQPDFIKSSEQAEETEELPGDQFLKEERKINPQKQNKSHESEVQNLTAIVKDRAIKDENIKCEKPDPKADTADSDQKTDQGQQQVTVRDNRKDQPGAGTKLSKATTLNDAHAADLPPKDAGARTGSSVHSAAAASKTARDIKHELSAFDEPCEEIETLDSGLEELILNEQEHSDDQLLVGMVKANIAAYINQLTQEHQLGKMRWFIRLRFFEKDVEISLIGGGRSSGVLPESEVVKLFLGSAMVFIPSMVLMQKLKAFLFHYSQQVSVPLNRLNIIIYTDQMRIISCDVTSLIEEITFESLVEFFTR